MTSPFAAAMTDASSVIDEVMGEPLRLEPQAKTSEVSPSRSDPERTSGMVVGVVTRHSAVLTQLGAGANSREHVELTEGRLRVSFDALAFSAGHEPRSGDRVVRISVPGAPAYRLLPGLPVPGRLVHPLQPVGGS